MKVTDKARAFALECCQDPKNKYNEAFEGHFIPMTKISLELGQQMGADLEIIEIAAWLHDLGSVVHDRKDHHLTGAELAEKKLTEWDYPKEKIDLIKKCILNHRGSIPGESTSIEEKVISEADAISNFSNIQGIFMASYKYENRSQEEAKKEVKRKLESKWNKLILEESKKMVLEKYKAAMLLFG